MITHLVLIKPRPDLSAADRLAFIAAFQHAAQEIPGIRGVRIGKRVAFGAGYERNMPDLADILAALDFDDVAGLKTYLEHPAHVELGRLFGQLLASALVYDFAVGGLEVLQSVAGSETPRDDRSRD